MRLVVPVSLLLVLAVLIVPRTGEAKDTIRSLLRPSRVDLNGDDLVSRAEFIAFFEKTDDNGDGVLDGREWLAGATGQALIDPAPKVGKPVPTVMLKMLGTDREVDLSKPTRLTVLIFGSHTCGAFATEALKLQETYEALGSKADFYMVYLREARPDADAKTIEARGRLASSCRKALELTFPFLIDDMQNSAARIFNAHPDRLFIVDADGRVAYRGGRGPGGFEVAEMRAALEELLTPSRGG